MKTTTTISTTTPRNTSPSPVINRLASVEEELIDRICRERNGQRILKICQLISERLLESYQGNTQDLVEFREQLFTALAQSREYTRKQMHCLVELSLDLVYAKLNNSYRRCNVDFGFLIATATGRVDDVSAN